MLHALLNLFIGCPHQRTSFPLTLKRKLDNNTARTETYIACLECGKEFEYDWQEMRIRKAVSMVTPANVQKQPLRT